jgi:hypothetical protein
MSKQVDERVVSMEFDNKRFESNVQTSMSTLDKLKQKLNLSGASKGLEEVQSAAKRVDMNGLSNGVETVRAKFSALQVMGVTALTNLTNSAVNAGKKMVSALTIDPIKTGFQEYETQMNAVQTILANTKSKGSTLDDVNKALDTLNTYADKTIYNFTEMTRNIGTFTAAGVDLQTSVDSIQGIANLAAVSGSSSQQASTAMYQLSQALAAGRVSLMDWNSVVNAGMGGELFQNALLRTSELLKTGGKEAVKTYGSFRESLTKGKWLTTEVLTETLKQLSGAYTEADLINQGFTKEQAKEIASLAKTANDAATKVKTFSQLWEVMKESAQSGWAQTWKLIVGDFEEAKALLTPLADFFTGVIGKMSEARNKLLESALGKSFTDLGKKISGLMEPINGTAKSVKGAMDAVKDYGKVVDEIIGGDWGNGEARWRSLANAGYDWAHAQNLVNEKLGDSTRHATNYKDAQDKVNKSQQKGAESSKTLTKEDGKRLEQLVKLSDAELKSLGYTKEQIDAFRELEKTAKKLGLPISEFIEHLDEINGRWLLINSFKNVGQSLVKIFTAIGNAWKNAFPPMQTNQLFNIIAGIHKFSTYLKMSDGTAKKLERTLKGVFAILDIVLTIIGGPIKIALKILGQLLAAFDMDILDLTAIIGDAIVKFRDWLEKTLDFTKVFEKLAPYITKATDAIKAWVAEAKPLEKIADFFSKATDSFVNWIEELKKSDNVPRDIIAGLINGFKTGVTAVGKAMGELGKKIIESICKVLGIESPSKEMEEVGKWTVEGFTQGIQNGASKVWEALKSFGLKCIEVIKNIDFGTIIAAGVAGGLMYVVVRVLNIFDKIGSAFEGFGDLLKQLGDGINSWFKAKAMETRSEAILNIAKSIAILAVSVFLLAKLDTGKLWGAIGALAALAAIIVAMAAISSKMDKIKEFKFPALTIIGMAASMLLLTIVLQKLASIDAKDMPRAMAMLAIMLAGMSGLMIAIGNFVKGKTAKNIDKVGSAILKISIALLLMTGVFKIVSGMKTSDLIKGGVVIALFGAFITGLIAASNLAGKRMNAVGSMILKISAAILLMAVTTKIIGSMDIQSLAKGLVAIVLFGGIIVGLLAAVKAVGKNTPAIGATILGVSAAILLMAGAALALSFIDPSRLAQGMVSIGLFGALIVGLIAATKLVGDNGLKAAASILIISVSVALLAAVAVALSLISIEGLAKGLIAVGLLGGLVIALMYATKDAAAAKANLIIMTVAIAVLAASVGLLSLIDPQKIAVATTALGSLMGMFALMMKMSSSLKNIGSMVGPVSLMLGVIVTLAAIIWALSALDVNTALGVSLGLSVLMISMSVSLAILSVIGKYAKDAAIGALALTLMAVPLLAFVGVLSAMSGVQNATKNVMALAALAIVCTVLLPILCVIGAIMVASYGICAVGIAALAAMALPLLAFVGVLSAMQDIDDASDNAYLLIDLVMAMAQILVLLGLSGPLAAVGLTALTALIGIMLTIAVLAVHIGAVMKLLPFLQDFLDIGIPVMVQLAEGVGQMIGAFIGGLVVNMAAGLPKLGEYLSGFMENAMVFIKGVKQVDLRVLRGAQTLIGTILALTGLNLINQIIKFMTLGSTFADLGTELSKFIYNAMPFIAGASLLTPDIALAMKYLAETIIILTAANVLNGLTSWFAGDVSLADFGKEIAAFGPGLKQFADAVQGIDGASVKAAAEAAKAITEMAETVPNEGGVAAWFAGENSIATFGDSLPKLGNGLKGFANSVKGIDCANVKAAAEAAKAITEMAENVPNDGGVAAWFAGENSIATFGENLPKLGKGLKAYGDSVKGLDYTSVNAATESARALAEMSRILPNKGGWAAWFAGDNTLADFSEELPMLGEAMKKFSDAVEGINPENVRAASAAAKNLAEMADTLPKNHDEIIDFGENLVTFGDDLVAFFNKATKELKKKDITVIRNAIESITEFMDSISNMIATSTGSMANLLKQMENKAYNHGKNFAGKFGDGLDVKKDDIEDDGEELGDSAIKGVKSKHKSMKDAGKYLGSGLVDGIAAKEQAVYDAAFKLGQKAVQGEKDGQKSNSPSKLTILAGKWLGEGLIIGMQNMTKQVYKSGSALGTTATSTISSAVSKISDVINSDIDAQPTIRPVLDLSDVRAGAGSINGMFSGRTLAVNMAGVGSVSAAMAGYQNGRDSKEIVSGIKALRKDIASMPRNTYSVNGVNIGDDEEVVAAFKTIVRATKMEGRT